MERVISVKDLQNSDLLGVKYTELDLYDAFMMYLILNGKPGNDRIVLRDNGYRLDSINCFRMNDWMV